MALEVPHMRTGSCQWGRRCHRVRCWYKLLPEKIGSEAPPLGLPFPPPRLSTSLSTATVVALCLHLQFHGAPFVQSSADWRLLLAVVHGGYLRNTQHHRDSARFCSAPCSFLGLGCCCITAEEALQPWILGSARLARAREQWTGCCL